MGMTLNGAEYEPDPLPSVQPYRRITRRDCRCVFRPGVPLTMSACDCGYWWLASSRFPHRWRPISKALVFRVWWRQLSKDIDTAFGMTRASLWQAA